MLESITLGIIQGIVEWLPISSEGVLVLAKIHIFGSNQELGILIREALFLHIGTFFAALIYFRKDVGSLLKALVNYKNTDTPTKKTLIFLIISTTISGILGVFILSLLENINTDFTVTGKIITAFIGVLLLITAILQLTSKKGGAKNEEQLTITDGIILGVMQGFAALPGLSRSGLTVSGLLLRKYNEVSSLKLSFLMSLPIVLGGNIVLNLNSVVFSLNNVVSLIFAFIFGILTIDLLLKLAQKINFGYFILMFGFLIIASLLI